MSPRPLQEPTITAADDGQHTSETLSVMRIYVDYGATLGLAVAAAIVFMVRAMLAGYAFLFIPARAWPLFAGRAVGARIAIGLDAQIASSRRAGGA